MRGQLNWEPKTKGAKTTSSFWSARAPKLAHLADDPKFQKGCGFAAAFSVHPCLCGKFQLPLLG
jgi:hypothetical protein